MIVVCYAQNRGERRIRNHDPLTFSMKGKFPGYLRHHDSRFRSLLPNPSEGLETRQPIISPILTLSWGYTTKRLSNVGGQGPEQRQCNSHKGDQMNPPSTRQVDDPVVQVA